jgi:hypothetical protein
MWAFRQTLLFSTLLQAVSCAWADNTLPQNPATPETPNPAARVLPRLHFLNEQFLGQLEKSTTIDPNFHHSVTNDARNKSELPESNRPPGLNFVLTGPHPGLEYKFSESGKVHLRIGSHGSSAAAEWSF